MLDQKGNQVLIAVRKDIFNKTIIENRTDLISYFYYKVLDIRKFGAFLTIHKKKIIVINIYDNKVKKD